MPPDGCRPKGLRPRIRASGLPPLGPARLDGHGDGRLYFERSNRSSVLVSSKIFVRPAWAGEDLADRQALAVRQLFVDFLSYCPAMSAHPVKSRPFLRTVHARQSLRAFARARDRCQRRTCSVRGARVSGSIPHADPWIHHVEDRGARRPVASAVQAFGRRRHLARMVLPSKLSRQNALAELAVAAPGAWSARQR